MKFYTGAIIFTLGAVTGAVGSLFYLRGEFKKKVDDEIAARDMAIRELKREKENSDREASIAQNKIDSKVSEGISKALGYSEDNVSALTRKPRRKRSDASERHSEGRRDVVYSVDENGKHEEYPREEETAEKPYGISSEDFLVTRKEYDKTTLTYYRKDGVLANEEGDICEDPSYLIGYTDEWMTEVGKYEDNIAYIRNEKVATDYEIVCEDKAYTEDWAI